MLSFYMSFRCLAVMKLIKKSLLDELYTYLVYIDLEISESNEVVMPKLKSKLLEILVASKTES